MDEKKKAHTRLAELFDNVQSETIFSNVFYHSHARKRNLRSFDTTKNLARYFKIHAETHAPT